MSLLDAMPLVRLFLSNRYPADFEKFPAGDPDELVDIKVLVDDPDGGADWNSADSTEVHT